MEDRSHRNNRFSQRRRSNVVEAGRIPRISRLMGLAIRYDGLLRDGVVRNQTELARLAHVTQPRMTQILNLLHLAPDLQEQILFLPRVVSGKDRVHEKMLRPIAAEVGWARQREMWGGLIENSELVSPEL